MLKHFIKYHSLGNDFIVYDWYKKPHVFVHNTLMDSGWVQFVKDVCDRHFGVGADGVLIIKSTTESSFPELLIFNADGSQAEMCINGLRCVAHYLFTHHHMQEKFKVSIGKSTIDCSIFADKNKGDYIEVETTSENALYHKTIDLQLNESIFTGHVVSVGNPHFIIFQRCDQSWLIEHGKELEQHHLFPQRTNVEFVWEDVAYTCHKNTYRTYRLLVYERGCGITLSCSSGVAAALWALFHLGKIKKGEHIAVNMLGGNVIGHITSLETIVLHASAAMIYRGDLEHKE